MPCVKYILSIYNKTNLNLLKNDMLWTPELAIALRKCGINNIEINCYNSNLYNDFKKRILNFYCEGFKFLQDAINENILIKEEKLTNSSLCEEIDNYEYLILCVESKILNDDISMSGGHYIILNGRKDNNVKVINPIKEKYEEKRLSVDFLVRASKDYGAWRILINEEK